MTIPAFRRLLQIIWSVITRHRSVAFEVESIIIFFTTCTCMKLQNSVEYNMVIFITQNIKIKQENVQGEKVSSTVHGKEDKIN